MKSRLGSTKGMIVAGGGVLYGEATGALRTIRRQLEARLRVLIRRERRQVGGEVLKVADLVLDPASLRATTALPEAMADADLVLVVVPSPSWPFTL